MTDIQNICKICGKQFRSLSGLGVHISTSHKLKPKDYYDLYLRTENEGLCSVCNKKTNFKNLKFGYRKYCSAKCSTNDLKVKEKVKQTNLKRYGTTCSLLNKEIGKKVKQTNLNKYGVECPLQNKKIRNKIKETCLNTYGVEYVTQSKEVQNKIKKTNLEKFGFENVFQNKEIQDKIKQTNLNKYLVEYPLQNKKIFEKTKQTNIKKYGVEYVAQNKEVREKYKQTNKIKFFNTLLNSDRLKDRCTTNFNINEFNGVHKKYSWICTKCNLIFEDDLENGKIPRCLNCYPILSGYSHIEKEIVEFIKSLGINVIENDRSILNGLELDIYIPSHNLAIEFNGLYWHSEISGNKNKNYHINKTNLCKKQNIQLLHIFEDEWIDKNKIVKSIIKSKLGLTNRIFARKCNIQIVSKNDANLFLFDNHLQGEINSHINIGLYYNNELVSLLSIGRPRFNKNYEYEILRFCNKINTTISGGLSKLFKYFVNKYNPKSVITYADLRYGSGVGYKKLGFEYKKISNPSYSYIKNEDFIMRDTRLNFQKHKLKDKLEIFDSNLTEWQNMQLNGYDRIWDCGCNVFEWQEN